MSRIRKLYVSDKDAWCKEFFPEYAEIFGGYPKPVKLSYGVISGYTTVPEMEPWETAWGLSGIGHIQASGMRMVQAPVHGYEAVDEDEYAEEMARRNYFRNGFKTPIGGPGLDPSVFVGAVDYRYGDYWLRRAKYQKQNLLVKPDYITCKNGRYFPMRGPTDKNPWGVNSAYIPTGAKQPIYQSDRYGPEHFSPPDWINLPHDPAGRIIIPTQADYDRARWSVYL